MMKTKYFTIALVAVLLTTLLLSCKKEWDAPPVRPVPVGGIKNIDSLKAWWNTTQQNYKVTVDASIYLTITADETSGNIYKEVFARDENNDAIVLKLRSSGGLYLGDSIRLNLNGVTLDKSNEQFQIDSVDVDNNVIKMATSVYTAPKVITIAQLDTTYESQLIQLNGVEYSEKYWGLTYADVINQQSTGYYLHDCVNKDKAALAYTSSYANFASQVIPAANGSVIAIAKRYNEKIELIFRNYAEIKLTTTACGDAIDTLFQTFTGGVGGKDLELVGWTNYPQQGSQKWEYYTSTPSSSTNPSGAVGFASEPKNITWLVTPPITNSPTKYLKFKNATKYNTNNTIQLFLYASTNYDGSNVQTATWIPINTDQITTMQSFFTTQKIELNNPDPFNNNTNILNNYTGRFHIAFKFSRNNTDSLGTYYIDNIEIDN